MNESVPFDLWFFCKVLSPWTTEEETLRLREAAASGKVDWQAVAVLSNRANLAPALRQALVNCRLWNDVPVGLREYLEEMYRFNASRNDRLRQELLEVVGLLNRAGMTPMPLKGSAALATGLYPDPAIRFMWDLDVLVPVGSIEKAVGVLKGAGYFVPQNGRIEAANGTAWHRVQHSAPLIREGGVARVELHRHVISEEWGALLNTEAVWRESSQSGSSLLPGVSIAVMWPAHQIIHCFIHSELAHMNHRYRRLNLRQLHHFAHLCRGMKDTIDWKRLASILEEPRTGRILGSYLHLAQSLFGVESPLSFRADAYATGHFVTAIHLMNGRWRRLRILRETVEDGIWCLSEGRMNKCCPAEDGRSAVGRRLYRLRTLLNKYSRLGPWKERVGATARKYESLG